MGTRLPNPQRAKIHRSYTVEEVARLYGVHRNTVRHWIRQGLRVCDDHRPLLVFGHELRAFLQVRRARNRHPCGPGRIYCVRCRNPQVPAGFMVDYHPSSCTGGSLVGICPNCDSIIYRRVSLAKLEQAQGALIVTLPKAHSRIGESTYPFVSSD